VRLFAHPRQSLAHFGDVVALDCFPLARSTSGRCSAAIPQATATDELLKQQLALDAATETVIAGLLLRGSISQWAAARKRLAALT
jgi:hypothetical protein